MFTSFHLHFHHGFPNLGELPRSPAVPRVEEGLRRGDAPNGAHALHGLPRLDPQLEGDLLRHGESMGDDVYPLVN